MQQKTMIVGEKWKYKWEEEANKKEFGLIWIPSHPSFCFSSAHESEPYYSDLNNIE